MSCRAYRSPIKAPVQGEEDLERSSEGRVLLFWDLGRDGIVATASDWTALETSRGDGGGGAQTATQLCMEIRGWSAGNSPEGGNGVPTII